MSRYKYFFFLLFSCTAFLVRAQPTLQTDLGLAYLVQQPAISAAHPPVIILMHGYGSNEADLFDLKEVLPQNFLIISVRAPLKLGENSFQWFRIDPANGNSKSSRQDLNSSADALKKFIPAVIKKYNADASMVYLSGFSQGAMMCYEVGLTAPQLFQGIAPLSGKIVESLKPQISNTTALKKLNIFIGHGDSDTRVGYALAVAAHNYLSGLGLRPEFHTYKGLQHSISKEELDDLAAWLKR